MFNIEEYVGHKYGNLTVVGVDKNYIGKTYNANHWLFLCDCGKTISDKACRVISGHKKSCGCRKRNNLLRHGCYNDPFYHTWWSMMQRCYNPTHHNYKRYGLRGIQVCDEWKSVEAFVLWAHETNPNADKTLSLDRIDCNANYEPSNCRWATSKLQMNNRRNTTVCSINGITKSLSEWCDEYKIPLSVVSSRIRVMGWDAEKALSTPIRKKSSR